MVIGRGLGLPQSRERRLSVPFTFDNFHDARRLVGADVVPDHGVGSSEIACQREPSDSVWRLKILDMEFVFKV